MMSGHYSLSLFQFLVLTIKAFSFTPQQDSADRFVVHLCNDDDDYHDQHQHQHQYQQYDLGIFMSVMVVILN